jgi:Family of unknown function (DUF5694)
MQRLLMALLLVASPCLAQERVPSSPISVLFLGTYHMENPGLDVNNAKADDPLTPRRQHELQNLTEELAKFRPTRVMVERVGVGQDLTPQSWREFTSAKLVSERDEAVQIAYRLADKLKIPVHGIDERDRINEPSYFPYDDVQKFAAKHGQGGQLDAMNDPVRAYLKRFEAAQATTSVAGLLEMWNDPAEATRDMNFNYGMLRFAAGKETPGADLNARWYLRNARIFSNVIRLSKPGDRVLIVFGSGHGYWLRHFASETPGFRNADPLPYLRRAAARK